MHWDEIIRNMTWTYSNNTWSKISKFPDRKNQFQIQLQPNKLQASLLSWPGHEHPYSLLLSKEGNWHIWLPNIAGEFIFLVNLRDNQEDLFFFLVVRGKEKRPKEIGPKRSWGKVYMHSDSATMFGSFI